MRTRQVCLLNTVALAAMLACDAQSDQPVVGLQAHSFAHAEWSPPVNLGPIVNSPGTDINPALSPDGLSLYFVSIRPGGFGQQDIWVSRRALLDRPWEPPVNLGPVINTPVADQGMSLSPDGHMLFFHSGRPGGHGAADLYVSHRTDPNDDFAWGPPVNLGPHVNTPEGEREPRYHVGVEGGLVGRPAILYFNRGSIQTQGSDLYAVAMTRDAQPLGPAVLLSDLSVPGANDVGETVRHDGREILFFSNRPGGLGGFDIWFATRRSPHDPWSTPQNVGAPVNTTFGEERPDLSFDGRTLLFDCGCPGGVGGQDIWMSTRTSSGH